MHDCDIFKISRNNKNLDQILGLSYLDVMLCFDTLIKADKDDSDSSSDGIRMIQRMWKTCIVDLHIKAEMTWFTYPNDPRIEISPQDSHLATKPN